MDEKILIGSILGITFGLAIYIWNSKEFAFSQKIIVWILIIFPPAQWLFALVSYLYNKQANTLDSFKEENIVNKYKDLEKLKNLEVLTEEEYKQKKSIIDNEILSLNLKNTEEYKSLLNLKKNNLINEAEFNNKIELLSNKLKHKNDLSRDHDIYIYENKAYLNGEIIENGIFRLKNKGMSEKAIEIKHFKIINRFYHILKKETDFGIIEIATDIGGYVEKGNFVWINNLPAKDGIYKWSFMKNINVKEGRIV